jgi:hypothetical protein
MWPNFGVQADGDPEAMSNADVLSATPGPYAAHADVRSSNVDPGSVDNHPMHPFLAANFYDSATLAWMDQVGWVPEIAFGA